MAEDFISQLISIVEEHIGDEQFGVSALADAVNMSRSNLLRKIKKQTGLSASQFIRKVRLEKAMLLLKDEDFTVSEISYKVGFGSTSYFIKCFREHYGYPPGEVGKQLQVESGLTEEVTDDIEVDSLNVLSKVADPYNDPKKSKKALWRYAQPLFVILLVGLVLVLWFNRGEKDELSEKSIAVLPFINESNDSTNVYFINGLMESTLNNLQKIEDLRVLSRTSVEKYRNANLSIPEIAEELNVKYLVEGSGQKVGDQVLLHIQLIEASTDQHIWAEQYNRKLSDVFSLQNEVATKIAHAIKAVVTPEELALIEKKPTDNLVAYDYYLQAIDPIYKGDKEGFEEAIRLLKKAVEADPEFALAYADISISYYLLDMYQSEKRYTELINRYADKALLYDATSDVSLLAKAFYYLHTNEYHLALPHLEKALEYNPNSAAAIQTLSDYYARINPNTSKYLEYALKGLQINTNTTDSLAQSYMYLHLSNAFVQSGFVEEANLYIDKCIDYYKDNIYANYVKAYVVYAKNKDINETRALLLKELDKDSTRLDIMQEVAKTYFFEEDYKTAAIYYDRFNKIRDERNLYIFPQEDIKMAKTYKEIGQPVKAERYLNSYRIYCENDVSIYKSASTAVLYAFEGKEDKAIEQLEVFAEQDDYQYWILVFMQKDPIMKDLQNNPAFKMVFKKIESKFWDNHRKLRLSLEEKGLI